MNREKTSERFEAYTIIMAAKFCSQKLEEYKNLVVYHGAFMTTICILNVTFSIVTVIANIFVIRALWKASSIPGNLRRLFMSLAVSDFCVALIPQLTFGIVVAVMLKMAGSGNYDFGFFCPTILSIRHFFIVLLIAASFFTVTAIATDRLLAICLHLRYQELVTSTRVSIALICLWFSSCLAASTFVAFPGKGIILIVIAFVGFTITTIAYCRIYKVVRYHRIQIYACQNRPADATRGSHVTMVTFLREAKSAINSFFVYVIFAVCYVPYLCTIFMLITDRFRLSFLLANYTSFFLMLLNSFLNPLVYCWRYREVRQIVIRMVKKMFCHQPT